MPLMHGERPHHVPRPKNWHSEKEYADMLADQQGGCAICREQCGTGRRLAVDHDHSNGRIRGLLCFRCNTSLARYEQYAQRFAEYLADGKIRTGLTL